MAPNSHEQVGEDQVSPSERTKRFHRHLRANTVFFFVLGVALFADAMMRNATFAESRNYGTSWGIVEVVIAIFMIANGAIIKGALDHEDTAVVPYSEPLRPAPSPRPQATAIVIHNPVTIRVEPASAAAAAATA